MPHVRELQASRLNLAVLAKAIESTRQTEGLSLRQVAADLGITPSTLTRIRQGKRPDAEALAVLATWADVSMPELLSPDDPARKLRTSQTHHGPRAREKSRVGRDEVFAHGREASR